MNSDNNPISPTLPWSIRGIETLLQRHPSLTERWKYELGVTLLAVQRGWEQTADERYFEYIQRNIDEFVDESGKHTNLYD